MTILKHRLFSRLRNRLILINLAVTTVILAVAFSMIYLLAAQAAGGREVSPAGVTENLGITVDGSSSRWSEILYQRVQLERQANLSILLLNLIRVGLLVEIFVAALSYFLAEIAIRPVQEAYENQKAFIANASHEIKTPLAVINANLEAADIQHNHWIDNVSREVKILTELNQSLLTLARADDGSQPAAHPENFKLKSLVEETISAFTPQAAAQGIKLELKTKLKTAKIRLAKADFQQILTILLDNAIKYGQSTVTISLHVDQISIKNDGSTIPPDRLAHIFERFYQADKNSAGVGLGLAIAKSLAERQNWQLSAESTHNFTTFTLKFAKKFTDSSGKTPHFAEKA